ncbi:hypothetical protein ON010_g7062 [Phytophthora cinnamomi]|nr:hypothetical protein ON010_g7062 [Phytophthora cinnamomi]
MEMTICRRQVHGVHGAAAVAAVGMQPLHHLKVARLRCKVRERQSVTAQDGGAADAAARRRGGPAPDAAGDRRGRGPSGAAKGPGAAAAGRAEPGRDDGDASRDAPRAAPTTTADVARSRHVAKRGNAVLKALLASLTSLSSHDEVDEEAVQALVDMLRDLCLQSMNATDVVALFDFLRLGRPPGRRRVLQMQKELVEMDTLPRAIFTMRGAKAGLIVPSEQQLFTRRGYSCSFGIHLDTVAAVVPLYSFRGQNGQGVSAVLEGNSLVVKMFAAQGAVQQVEVPFAEWIDKMEKEWVHVCIVHAKKMVFKDKVTVFVDGKSVFNGNLGYPDPLMMVGGQNSIGIEPLAESLKGKLWSPTLFGVALSEAEVQRLHWLTHWKNDLNSVAAENVGLTDKSKFCFCYDARSCDLKRRVCYDVSGNDCHGSLGPGTSAYVTQSFVHALDSVGGCACFLLLLLDQIPEMADFHPVHEFGMGEISDLLEFVGVGLRRSTVCRSHFVRLHGVKVVEFILQSISPSYLSVHLLNGVVSILEAMTDFLESDEEIMEYIYRLLFFNTSWFLSPFDTQVKLLGEVLPKYLQLLQKVTLRERSRLADTGSPTSNSGKLVVSRAASLSEFSRSLDAKDQVDVSFFCRLISQVYILGGPSDKEEFTASQMDSRQLAQLRNLVLQNLVDLLLFPPFQDTASDQWRQLTAYIFRQCETKRSCDDDSVDVEDILQYLTQNLASIEPRKIAVGVPTRQIQLTTNIFKLSKGTVRVLWRPMLSTKYNVRLAALQLFELYTSEKVLLHKSDMLMLYSSFQAHTLTADIADLLLDIVIGRKRVSPGNTKPAADVRTGSFARMTFIPLVLLSLIHNANFDVQARILAEIRIQLSSPTMGDSVKEAMRSWPSWMSRLRSLTMGASVAVAANTSAEIGVTRERSLTQSEELNEACVLLSADSTSAFAKLGAVQLIEESGDVSGCDFALSLLQNRSQSEAVVDAIIEMVINQYPQRWCELTCKLANQMIVDIVVYCILHVKNGWMHFLEFYYCHCRTPSDLCSLTAVICEQAVRQAGQKHPMPQSEIIWENLCQVAAIVSQSSLVATKMCESLNSSDVVLSPGQESILVRKAFELWQVVLPHLNRINWDGLMANLIQNAEYGSEVAFEETAIFTHLVASRSRSIFLALQTTIKHVTLTQANSSTDVELVRKFHNVLELLKLIASLPVATSSQRSSGSLSPLSGSYSPGMSTPPVSGSVLPDMALALPLSGITDSSKFFTALQETGSVPERELIHMYTLDACYTILEASLEGHDIETVRLLVKIMVALANTALHLRDPSAKPELTKTLQIISSTDLTFFSDLSQFRELFMLWRLHRENHHMWCDSEILQAYVDALHADFVRRWIYVMEHHTGEFNPYLIQQHASSQAEVLGRELQQCETLWEEITAENEAAEVARASEQDMVDDSRLVELKHSTEKFASSVHKLLAHSSHDAASTSLFGEDHLTSSISGQGCSNSQHDGDGRAGGDGVILKIDSRENSFRMRLRLKRVTEEYRARNLSCDPASSLTETESKDSGRKLSRRFRGSIQEGLADLEHSWRSDAGSDYSDFLADAQMRAAIIRSLSNPEEYESAYGGTSDEDDLDADDMNFYDAEEDDELSQPSGEPLQKDELIEVAVPAQREISSVPFTASDPVGIPGTSDTVTAAPVSPSPLSPMLSQKAASPLSPFSLGASVLTVVGGVADYFQKSVKDAKDAVEYGVDSLYTTKDAVSEEAQALVQEVSTYIDSTQGSKVTPTESVVSDTVSLELTPSSLKMMESKLSPDKADDGLPELFPSSSSVRNADHEKVIKRTNARSKIDMQVNAQLRDPSVRRLRHPSSLFRNSLMSNRWVQHEISTFEYLMWLNTIAGRTYNDLTQYPVFPWIISDYESATLDFGRREAYRDLTKPMGALEPTRLKFFVDRYNAFEDPDIPKFM